VVDDGIYETTASDVVSEAICVVCEGISETIAYVIVLESVCVVLLGLFGKFSTKMLRQHINGR